MLPSLKAVLRTYDVECATYNASITQSRCFTVMDNTDEYFSLNMNLCIGQIHRNLKDTLSYENLKNNKRKN